MPFSYTRTHTRVSTHMQIYTFRARDVLDWKLILTENLFDLRLKEFKPDLSGVVSISYI